MISSGRLSLLYPFLAFILYAKSISLGDGFLPSSSHHNKHWNRFRHIVIDIVIIDLFTVVVILLLNYQHIHSHLFTFVKKFVSVIIDIVTAINNIII